MAASNDKLTPFAKVIKSFGTEGEVIVKCFSSYMDDIDQKKPVFIDFDGILVPFFIRSLSLKGGSRAVIKLGGVDSFELAEEIVGQLVYSNYILEEGQEDFESLIGFTVTEATGEVIGEVASFYDYPNNPCLEVTFKNKKEGEFLLPLHSDIITDINLRTKTIVVILPEGLTNLNS